MHLPLADVAPPAPRLSARKMMRRLVRSACLALIFAAPVAAETVQLGIEDARVLARQAYLAGDLKLANQIAYGLLKADPSDPQALILIAATDPALGRPKEGRKAAARAFRSTKDPALRFETSFYAASAAVTEEKYSTAKYWLRRSYQAATTEEQKTNIATAFRKVRARDPLSVQLDFGIAPSNNINNGSDSDLLVIDGVFPIGVLSGTAQALSGLRYSLGADLKYTLSEDPTHKTTLGMRVSSNFYSLSSEAKRLAPTARSSEFETLFVDATLEHKLAAQGKAIPDEYRLSVGGLWYGGSRNYQFVSAGLARSFRASDRVVYRLSGTATHLDYTTSQEDAMQYALDLTRNHRLESGDFLALNLGLRAGKSDDFNAEYTGLEARAFYAFGKPMGPVQLDLGLTLGLRDYEDYRIGFLFLPNGREDKYAAATVGMTLPDLNYFGFVPRVTLRAQKTNSNISRFEQNSFSLAIGLRSAF